MNLFDRPEVVTKLTLAIRVIHNTGRNVTKNRKAHGFAYMYGGGFSVLFDDGTLIRAGEGEIIFLPKGSNYTVIHERPEVDPERGCYAVNFLLEGGEVLEPFRLSIKNRSQVATIFQNLIRMFKNRRPGHYEQSLSELYRLLGILRELKESDYSTPAMKVLDPAVTFIREHYLKDTIVIGSLAKLCAISEPYFRRLFLRELGDSPVNYIRKLRLNYAKSLIDAHEYSITEIAQLSGFNDSSYFSREFKRAFLISPKKYALQKEADGTLK